MNSDVGARFVSGPARAALQKGGAISIMGEGPGDEELKVDEV